ncbi:hypothetical protein ES702_01571 [subsurface metagenome]
MSTCVAPLVSAYVALSAYLSVLTNHIACMTDSCLSRYDLYRSMHAASHRLPQPRVFGPPVLGEVLIDIAPSLVERLPSGFRKLARNGKLPLELVGALSRTSQIIHDRQQQPFSINHDYSGEVTNNLSQPGLHTGWWTACPSLLSHPILGHDEPEISNLLSMGLWLYVALEFSTDSIFETFQHWISAARWLRHDLSTKLLRCVMIRSDDEEHCLKWLIRIAIESWRGPNHELLSLGLDLERFRRRRFVWPCDPDDGFFVFTK